MEDRRGKLSGEAPFSYRLLKDGKAIVYYDGKAVYTAVGKDYARLLRAIELDDEYRLQLFLAKVTGNFKHGNER